MNPGGDFGKKELSPALRNRFTEIWVPPVDDADELRSIALRRYIYIYIFFCFCQIFEGTLAIRIWRFWNDGVAISLDFYFSFI